MRFLLFSWVGCNWGSINPSSLKETLNHMDECKKCEKGKSHISKCTNKNGTCKYFPYDMGNNTEDLYVPKRELSDTLSYGHLQILREESLFTKKLRRVILMSKLKLCPRCGSKNTSPVMYYYHGHTPPYRYKGHCFDCGYSTQPFIKEELAIQEWNKERK